MIAMNSPSGILALDLAGRTGWAFGHLSDARPRCGVWVLPPPSDLGRTYACFENELLDALTIHNPALVVLEAALPAGGQGNALVAQQQIGLAAHAHSACYRREIKIVQYAASTMRKEVIGTGRFPAGEAKKRIGSWLSERGFTFPDHNSADAIVCWLYAKSLLTKSRAVPNAAE